jgi:hypothetical protein
MSEVEEAVHQPPGMTRAAPASETRRAPAARVAGSRRHREVLLSRCAGAGLAAKTARRHFNSP